MNAMCRGQDLTTSQVDDSTLETKGPRAFFGYRDPGIAQATQGRFGAHIIRGIPFPHRASQQHTHDRDLRMDYVPGGRVPFWDARANADLTGPTHRAGTFVRQPAGIRHRDVKFSTDMDPIEIVSPAGVSTHPSEVP